MNFPLQLKVVLSENKPLKEHCTFQIGGNAALFAAPKTREELNGLLSFARDHGMRMFILGNGSNVLFSDNGFPGLVIAMVNYNTNHVACKDNTILCSAGVSLSTVVNYSSRNSLGGLEFAYGIPGTIGGAIRQNASFGGKSIADVLNYISVVDACSGKLQTLRRDELKFSYRSCQNLSGVIIEAAFTVYPREQQLIESEIQKHQKYRKSTQDLALPSAGCIFKNPEGGESSAGVLIDRCGLKGYAIGGAQISNRHANYIININGASAQDVLTIIDHVRSVVRKQHSIDLELEVEYVE